MMSVGVSGNEHGVDRAAQHLLECASGRSAEVRRKSLGHLPLACPYRGELCSSHMPESGRKAPCGIASADHTPRHHSRHPGLYSPIIFGTFVFCSMRSEPVPIHSNLLQRCWGHLTKRKFIYVCRESM